MKVLVVEDNVALYQGYLLRILTALLPEGKVEFHHVSSIPEAARDLFGDWDIILMDYNLPGAAEVCIQNPPPIQVRNGADLIACRRLAERAGTCPPALILGMTVSHAESRILTASGANESFLKLQVPDISKAISERITL
jgi:CheY-like chemotaxis protein